MAPPLRLQLLRNDPGDRLAADAVMEVLWQRDRAEDAGVGVDRRPDLWRLSHHRSIGDLHYIDLPAPGGAAALRCCLSN